jgi:hypothetical protein
MKNSMLQISKQIWKKKNMWSTSTVNNSIRGSKNYMKKMKSIMRGVLYWEENAWLEPTYIDLYEVGHYKPKTDNSSAQNIGQICLLVGKYKSVDTICTRV